MEQMAAQAVNCGAEPVLDTITAVDLSCRPFVCTADSGDRYAPRLIPATGAQARWLGLPSEQKFAGHGVSACHVRWLLFPQPAGSPWSAAAIPRSRKHCT